jgi:release factor glutamine methyltransferase
MLVFSRPSHHGDTAVDFDAATSRAEALLRLRRAFSEAGIDTPDLDARVLLMEALQVDAVEFAVRPHVALGPDAAPRLVAFARRRLAYEPVGRILGRREFWGLTFELSADTLEPRPDTETVVETALSLIPDRDAPLRILDLGTGSGCILVALLHEVPAAFGVGVDRSLDALRTARRNAARSGVGDRATFVASDWAAAVAGRFDLVVSNPPYIASAVLADLAPEVREHDPTRALDGGPDGLAAYRAIVAEAPRLLGPGGGLVLEIGWDQEEAIRTLARPAGLDVRQMAQDLRGHPRAVVLQPGRQGALANGNAALI